MDLFNVDHYNKVREYREKVGLPNSNLTVELIDHELINKSIKNLITNKIGIIEKIFKQFYCGWYISYLVCYEGNSHGVVIINNINSFSNEILNIIEENEKNFIIL